MHAPTSHIPFPPDVPRRYSQLTSAQKELLRKCQEVQFGAIQDVVFHNADPILKPAPKIRRKIKLKRSEAGPIEHASHDFELKDEQRALIRYLREHVNGSIAHIQVQNGLPSEIDVTDSD
jgi:hypothetical protein